MDSYLRKIFLEALDYDLNVGTVVWMVGAFNVAAMRRHLAAPVDDAKNIQTAIDYIGARYGGGDWQGYGRVHA